MAVRNPFSTVRVTIKGSVCKRPIPERSNCSTPSGCIGRPLTPTIQL